MSLQAGECTVGSRTHTSAVHLTFIAKRPQLLVFVHPVCGNKQESFVLLARAHGSTWDIVGDFAGVKYTVIELITKAWNLGHRVPTRRTFVERVIFFFLLPLLLDTLFDSPFSSRSSEQRVGAVVTMHMRRK